MPMNIQDEGSAATRLFKKYSDVLVMTVVVSACMFYFDKGSTYPATTVIMAFAGCLSGHTAVMYLLKKFRK